MCITHLLHVFTGRRVHAKRYTGTIGSELLTHKLHVEKVEDTSVSTLTIDYMTCTEFLAESKKHNKSIIVS